MRCGQAPYGRAVLGACPPFGVRAVGVGEPFGGEVAVADRSVVGDVVLQVQQVRVLRPGHYRAGRVEKFTAGPVTVGETLRE